MIDLIAGIFGGRSDGRRPRLEQMLGAMAWTRQHDSVIGATTDGVIGAVRLVPEGAPPPKLPPVAVVSGGIAVASARLPGGAEREPEFSRWIAAALDDPAATASGADFAIAAIEGSRLRLVRDRLGIRPLFHCTLPDGAVAFASAPEALLAIGAARGEPDCAALMRMMLGPCRGEATTALRGILRVGPAEEIVFQPDGTEARRRRYWALRPARIRPLPDFPAAARLLRDGIDAAVHRAIPANGPVASHLSGGLDSPMISAVAVRHAGPRLMAWCATTPESRAQIGAIDQWQNAEAAAALAGIDLRPMPADYISACLDGPLMAGFPAPLGDCEPDERILRAAAAEGAGLLLHGLGGNDGVSHSGGLAFADALIAGRLGALQERLGPHAQALGRRPFAQIGGELATILLPAAAASRLRRLRDPADSLEHGLTRFCRPAFRPPPQKPALLRPQRMAETVGSNLYLGGFEFRTLHAARHGIALAFPLLDPDLLALCLALPAPYWVDAGHRRMLMRAAMEGLVPDRVRLDERKLADDPTERYFLSAGKHRLAALCRELGETSPAVSATLDTEAMARAFEALDPPEAVAAHLAAAAARGEQGLQPDRSAWLPLLFARFIAAAEARAAARPDNSA